MVVLTPDYSPPTDRDAVLRHKGLVGLVFRRFARRLPVGDPLRDDLHSELWVALIQAARDFDPSRGASFGTFAVLCLKNQALNFFNPRLGRAAFKASCGRTVVTAASFARPAAGDAESFDVMDLAVCPDHVPGRDDADELAAKVGRALHVLDREDRAVCELMFDLGTGETRLTPEQVAEKCRQRRQTTHNAVHRVRGAFRLAFGLPLAAVPRPSPGTVRKIPESAHPEFARRFHANESVGDMAAAFGVSPNTVTRLGRVLGLDWSARPGYRCPPTSGPTVPAADIPYIARRVLAGEWTLKQVAARYGIQAESARKIVVKYRKRNAASFAAGDT